METPIKLSIGMPVYDSVCVETMLCAILALRTLPYEIHFNFRKGTYLHDARNQIVKEALKVGATHLMFIDSDLTFPEDGITRLMSHKKDIIGGAYNMKSLPPTSTIKLCDENGEFISKKDFEVPADKPFKVYAVPTGFMLIRLDAIKDMIDPFDFGKKENGELIGEDVNFCIRAQKEMGLDIWCDASIKIGHIGQYLY